MLGTNSDFTNSMVKKKKRSSNKNLLLDRRLESGVPDSHSETLEQKHALFTSNQSSAFLKLTEITPLLSQSLAFCSHHVYGLTVIKEKGCNIYHGLQDSQYKSSTLNKNSSEERDLPSGPEVKNLSCNE